jgi:hypothetical protein
MKYDPAADSPDSTMLARLWPHRAHESNWFNGLLCACGLHRWHRVALPGSSEPVEYRFCRWCPAIVPQREEV